MPDTKIITKEIVINAIDKYKRLYNKGEIDRKNESILYDVIYEDIRYPASYIFKMAYEQVHKIELERNKFSSKRINSMFQEIGFQVKNRKLHIFTFLPSNKKDDKHDYIGRSKVINEIRKHKKIFHSSLNANKDFTFVSKQDYEQEFIKQTNGGNNYYSLLDFIYNLHTFSLVFLINNNETIKMILEISGNYKYTNNPTIPFSNHERSVKILWDGELKIPQDEKKLRASEQVNRIDKKNKSRVDDILKVFKKYDNQAYHILKHKLNKSYDYNIKDELIEEKEYMNQAEYNLPLNQILYGPPGTGKTYNTINKALEIILEKEPDEEIRKILDKAKNGEIENTDRKRLLNKFNQYRDNEQIEFVTFHQSYGYEEFVEGIKAIPPNTDGDDNEQMYYDIKPGIFKEISRKAENLIIGNKSENNYPIEYELDAPNLNIQARMIQDNDETFRVLTKSKIRKNETATFNNEKTKSLFLEKANYREEDEYYILEEDYIFQSKSSSSSVILGRSSNGQADWKMIEDKTSEHKNIESKTLNKNYILIIDEINRGNISKIFGELITLIEPSKRIGADEEIRVKLPYSGEEGKTFGVPSNLYVIGTMNTADRSIAQIDTALRRRFVFEEMMPKPELLVDKNNEPLIIEADGKEIEVQKILEAMNERIEYIHDREHTIGHSYFMPLIKDPTKEKLDDIFKVNIIPLLAEYFYSDWGDIKFVLNNDFIEEKPKMIYKNKKENRQLNKVYKITDKLEVCQYMEIYNEDCKQDSSYPDNDEQTNQK